MSPLLSRSRRKPQWQIIFCKYSLEYFRLYLKWTIGCVTASQKDPFIWSLKINSRAVWWIVADNVWATAIKIHYVHTVQYVIINWRDFSFRIISRSQWMETVLCNELRSSTLCSSEWSSKIDSCHDTLSALWSCVRSIYHTIARADTRTHLEVRIHSNCVIRCSLIYYMLQHRVYTF